MQSMLMGNFLLFHFLFNMLINKNVWDKAWMAQSMWIHALSGQSMNCPNSHFEHNIIYTYTKTDHMIHARWHVWDNNKESTALY